MLERRIDVTEEKKSNLANYMANPRTFTIRKWMSELLKEKYAPHDPIVERIAASLVTDRDLKDFGSLITQVYEQAYRKAVSDYQTQVEQLGLKIHVIPSQTNDGLESEGMADNK